MEAKIRAERSDKKIRVAPSLDKETHAKLKRLSLACDMPKTQLAEEIIKISVNNPSLIEHIQKIFKASDEFRVIPVVENGKVHY